MQYELSTVKHQCHCFHLSVRCVYAGSLIVLETETGITDKPQPFEIKTEDITEHPQNNKRRRYMCTVCEKQFTHKGHMKRHIQTHTGEKQFACTVCDKRFTTKYYLNYHTQRHTVDINAVENRHTN